MFEQETAEMWKVNDPVWGSISFHPSVESAVKEVISTEFFQRLRYTTHLGLAQLVYPSANHTRFSHSLGVAYLADLVATNLRLSDTDRRVLVISALLHDFGHPPFSHSFLRGIKAKFTKIKSKGHFAGLVKIHDDKNWGKQINDSLEKIDDLPLPENDKQKVCELLYGSHKLSPLLNADIDLDRMDYLCRDAHFCGLPYAADTTYLLNNIDIDGEKVVFKKSAINACEGLLFSRLQMTKTVYQHPLVKAYEDGLEKLIELLLEKDSVLCESQAPKFFEACLKNDTDEREICREFLKLTEASLWVYFSALSKQMIDSKIKQIAEHLTRRNMDGVSSSTAQINFYKGTTLIKVDQKTVNLSDVSDIVKRMTLKIDEDPEQEKTIVNG